MLLDFGLLLLRLVLGVIVAAHGAQKVLCWYGGSGIEGTRHMMRSLNFHPSSFWAWVSGLNEFGGGILTALGILMPLGPLMIIVILYVHMPKGFWNMEGGIEYPLILGTSALTLALTSAGVQAIDAAIRFALPEPQTLTLGLVIVLAGVVVTMVITGRRLAQAGKHTLP